VLRTSGKDSLIQSIPAVLAVFSNGMINNSLLTPVGPGCCWAGEGIATARAARYSNERTIPTGFLKITRL
jgi:hypothetical protein